MGQKHRRDIPRFDSPIIETHCHLDYLDPAELDSVLERTREVGVERIITIAVATDNLDRVMELTRASPMIWGTQGVHPHEAACYDHAVGARIRANAADPRVVAIGEIGLDYYYDHTERAVQRHAFEQQLQLAAELNLPVVIHTRDADEDTRAILRNMGAAMTRKGVIHSFTASQSLADYCLAEGFFLGFNGIATFNSAQNVRSVVATTPASRILLETDAPYLTPVPYRGRPNAPYFLPFIAEAIAAIKRLDIEDLLRHAYRNSLELFFEDA